MLPRILVVDDEPDVRDLVQAVLHGAFGQAVRVDTAADGCEAKALLGAARYDLVVSDHRMPCLTGLDLLAWARVARPWTRRVLMTAYDDDALRRAAAAEAGAEVLRKPFAVAELVGLVRATLPPLQQR